MKIKLRNLLLAGTGFSVFAFALVFSSGAVSASPNNAPDLDLIFRTTRYGASYDGNVPWEYMYAVSNDGFTDITHNKIKVYMPTPNGTIKIADPNICVDAGRVLTGASGGNPAYYTNYDAYYGTRSSGQAVRFTVTNTQGTKVGGSLADGSRYGHWDGTTACQGKTRDFAVSGSQLDPATGMYPYFLEVNAMANGRYINGYRVEAPSGSYVTQDVTDSPEFFAMMQTSPIPEGNNPQQFFQPDPYDVYSYWRLPFAPDCSVTTPTVRDYIEIYDDDNATKVYSGDSGANSPNYDVQPRAFVMRMAEYDRSGNFTGFITPTRVAWEDGGGWTTTPSTNSSGGWRTRTLSGERYEHVYTTGNEKWSRIEFEFKQDRVYQFRIYYVFYDNALQFELPFETVYYYQECQMGSVKLLAGMSVNPVRIGPGENATFTPSITASEYQRDTTVNCDVERVTYRPDGSIAFSSAQPCVTTSGGANIEVTGNGTITLNSNIYNAPASIEPGSRVCETITITDPSDARYYNDPADRSATSCVDIVGRPYLSAIGGDVWAGSRFSNATNNCGSISPRLSEIRSWTNGAAGSFGEFGVTSLGPLIGFGSGNRANNDGLTFANTPSDGNFGAPTRCLPDYFGQVGTEGAAWSGIGSIVSNGGQQVFYGGDGANVTISGGTVPLGAHAVLVVDGDVSITGNIDYPGTYANDAEISTLWIIAKGNINIQENVTQLSGMYVAQSEDDGTKGIIQTCTQTGTATTHNPLTVGVCGEGLDVFGALVADKIYWQRTRGSAAASQPYAERITFDPALYLNSPLQSDDTNLEVQDVKELPPIY